MKKKCSKQDWNQRFQSEIVVKRFTCWTMTNMTNSVSSQGNQSYHWKLIDNTSHDIQLTRRTNIIRWKNQAKRVSRISGVLRGTNHM